MRQCGQKHFCEMLNRLRKGESSQQDLTHFNSRVVSKSSPDYKKNIRHVYPLTISTRLHNETIFSECQEEKVVIPARNTITGNRSETAKARALLTVQTSEKHNVIHGLHRELHIAVSLMYAVSCNLEMTDGLINGAECQMMKIEYKAPSQQPAILWVHFNDASIGMQCRVKFNRLYTSSVHKRWIPIFAVKRETSVLNGRVVREQFPLKPSAATTIHACQGSSFENICIDMDVTPSAAF